MYNTVKFNCYFTKMKAFIDAKYLLYHYNNYYKKCTNILSVISINKCNYEEMLTIVNESNNKSELLFNLGRVINHEYFFSSISNKKVLPKGYLKRLINNKYGSYKGFKKSFKEKALSIPGVGYTYLIFNGKDIDIVNLQNEDIPISNDYIPLLCIDMWEHAYCMKYNNKEDYINKFFAVVDFSFANKLLNYYS